jgi:acyl carrier protein
MAFVVNALPPDCGTAQETSRIVAAIVASKLERSGVRGVSAEALLAEPELSRRDFAALGLSSVDWMDAASDVEDAFGIEFSDDVMLDAAQRSVAGWSEHANRLRRLMAVEPEPTSTLDGEACDAKGEPCV